jgi:hypothetical protein
MVVRTMSDNKPKRRYSLLPWRAIGIIVDVLTHGAEKHSDFGWVDVPSDDHFNAAMRHLTAWRTGHLVDPDSGYPHLAHAACRVIFLLFTHQGRG